MKSVFISRDLESNSPFKQLLGASGFKVEGQSLVQFSPIPFKDIPPANWLFFYSKKAVHFFFEGLKKISNTDLSAFQLAAFGSGTAQLIQSLGYTSEFIGDGKPETTAAAFLATAKNQKTLFIRAENSRQSVQKLLTGKINMKDLIVYKNEMKTDFTIETSDYLVFTSPLNVQAYRKKYNIKSKQEVVAIGQTTAQALKIAGWQNILIAAQPTEEALAQTILKDLNYLA